MCCCIWNYVTESVEQCVRPSGACRKSLSYASNPLSLTLSLSLVQVLGHWHPRDHLSRATQIFLFSLLPTFWLTHNHFIFIHLIGTYLLILILNLESLILQKNTPECFVLFLLLKIFTTPIAYLDTVHCWQTWLFWPCSHLLYNWYEMAHVTSCLAVVDKWKASSKDGVIIVWDFNCASLRSAGYLRECST